MSFALIDKGFEMSTVGFEGVLERAAEGLEIYKTRFVYRKE